MHPHETMIRCLKNFCGDFSFSLRFRAFLDLRQRYNTPLQFSERLISNGKSFHLLGQLEYLH